ncbi:phosphoenolpyruvate--protein phosphotransferase [Paenibacillus turpanensis]|uniref:phosphoenolpyruvate--protein phosphotransferase n=1 Tax=Paenibacillus turpanensis TaxID=2689078 RepID=UPI00140C7D72|nr:phosphoenolpyruvate--protein phosphotransferase [Paenibacillus turpanensis]
MKATEIKLRGLGVSDGTKAGKAFVYKPFSFADVVEGKADNPDTETVRLQEAKAGCVTELNDLIEKAQKTLGEEKATILKGQISFLNDPSFYPPMEKLIANDRVTAETAVLRITNQVAAIFESMPNEYMRERAADVRDVGRRLLSKLVNFQGRQLSDIQEEVIVVADDLTPSDTVQLDKRFVLGFVTRIGGKTSHTAILANSLGIAAVLGLGAGVEEMKDEDLLIINGATGECILRPEQETLAAVQQVMAAEVAEKERLQRFTQAPAMTKDGVRFEIAANIGTPEEAVGLPDKGAEAVGLYRTEFLFMSRSTMPDEETQFKAYKDVAESMQGKPVVVRTLDIGGDKELPYLQTPHELNPFLGYRAIRLCLDQQELFRTQLRAILRASAFGALKVMFPMISGLQEWRQAKAIYDDVRAQLVSEGVTVGEKVELGIMVEIPSAALLARQFAKEVDFFSIGTNDLVQYTVAVDRMNEKVSYLYDYFHPAVIQLIKQVIDASKEAGKWTGMCGSMAGDPLAAPLLAGLGLHEWSMSSASIQKVKEAITKLNKAECEQLVERVLAMDTAEQVREALIAFQSKS